MTRNEVYWRCRRATLELDLLFNGFFAAHYDHLTPSEQLAFQQLLEVDDQILIAWFFQSQNCTDRIHVEMVQQILAFASGEQKP